MAATKFVEDADAYEAKVELGKMQEDTMTAHYLLKFADIWRIKFPRNQHRDYAE